MTATRATVNESLVTARGYELLREELAKLQSLGRRQMSERLSQVRQDARFDDSSALSGALEEQAQLESRIATLEGRLATAQIAQPTRDGSAGVGSSVCVRHLDSDQVVEYELVGAIDPGIGDGRVSIVAPVGRALLGCRAGAVVEVIAPRGVIALEILSVRSQRLTLAA